MPINAYKQPNAKPPVLKLRQKQKLFVENTPMMIGKLCGIFEKKPLSIGDDH